MHHLMKHWNGDSLGLRTSSTSKGLWPWPLFYLLLHTCRTAWGLLFVDQYYLLETWTCSQSRHEGGVIQSSRTPTAAIGQPQWQQRDKIEQIGDGEEHGEWRRTRRQDRLSLSGSFRLHFKGKSVMPSQGPCGELAKRLLEFHMETVSALGASGGKMAGWVEPLWIGLRIASSWVLSSFFGEIERQEALVIVPSHHGGFQLTFLRARWRRWWASLSFPPLFSLQHSCRCCGSLGTKFRSRVVVVVDHGYLDN